MPHGHVHVPHELTEGSGSARPDRAERVLELLAVLLMSIATVATAWSGYQAARWSGDQAQNFARSSATRIAAQREVTAAGQLRIDDLLNFNGWLDAREAGDRDLAAIYERRFRPEFKPAFKAWLAQRPLTGGEAAVAGPLYAPQYRQEELERAAVIDGKADAFYAAGTKAKRNDDRYILSTVFFAAVLFFAGISLRLLWRPLRIAVLALAALMLLGGGVFVATLPIA